MENQRSEAGRRGGMVRPRPIDLPDTEALSAGAARSLLAALIAAVLTGAVDPVTARTVGYLLSIDTKVHEVGELEERIGALEQFTSEKKERSR